MKTKTPITSILALFIALGISPSRAANILWVSIAPPLGFSGPGSGYTDSGFVTLLQNAGHNVNRFHPAESQNTLLTQAEIDAMNTNDLVIIGRCAGSGAWQAPQGLQWNTNVTKPLMCMSPYLVRTIAASRMGWFNGDVGPDDTPTVLSAVDPTDPKTDYLLGGVFMNGTNTASVYDEIVDRNTSHMLNPPVAGGRTLISATFIREDNEMPATGHVITEFPAGTVTMLNSSVLAGYRMFFAGGSREGASAPNGIPQFTGRETLTPTGEDIFLRAVQLALSGGLPPATNPNEPIAFIQQPVNALVDEGASASFSAAVTGAAQRTLQWQRDIGDGVTFTNIPDAVTPFLKTRLTLPAVALTDSGAHFRVVASNSINSITSDVVRLTVAVDTTAPVALSAASVDGAFIGICFDEALDNSDGSATDTFSYSVNGGAVTLDGVTLRPDGKSVLLDLSGTVGANFTVTISNVKNKSGIAITETTLNGTSLGLTTADVGGPNPAGSSYACDAAAIQISGGGLDMASTADQMHFAYKTVNGDFDAHVRVREIRGSTRVESVAKAALMARENDQTGAAGVNVFATLPTPGNDWIWGAVRPTTGGATNALGPVVIPTGMPNTWLRIKRAGNNFTSYQGSNGVNWTQIGTATLTLPPSIAVGLGVVSHRTGILATGVFSDFVIDQSVPRPTIVNPVYSSGSFSASFQTESGVGYTVQYKDALVAGPWNMLTTITGDGTLQSFTDPGPVSPTGNRFYQISIP